MNIDQIISETDKSEQPLLALRKKFEQEQARVAEFCEHFLFYFGNRVLEDRAQTPEWKLHTKKTSQYNALARGIRVIDYYLAKERLKNA